MTDRAFFYDWLVVDVIFDEPRVFDPLNVQICDPARPTTVRVGRTGTAPVGVHGAARRVDRRARTTRPRRGGCSNRGTPRPDNARLEKHAVYRFQARWVEEWRRGRVLLAGDAAHQTPPFAGQGLCSGLRDAANLAWKLDLVLRGTRPDTLLDTYGLERGPHMQAVIELAIEMGKLICVADPPRRPRPRRGVPRRLRRQHHRRSRRSRRSPTGIVLAGSPGAGELFLQGEVERDGVRTRFDDVVGAGWRLVTVGPTRPSTRTWPSGSPASAGSSSPIGCGPGRWSTSTDAYRKWFAEHGVVAALQRPDFVAVRHGDARRPQIAELLPLAARLRCRSA